MIFSDKDENQRLLFPEGLYFFHHCLSLAHEGLYGVYSGFGAGRSLLGWPDGARDDLRDQRAL